MEYVFHKGDLFENYFRVNGISAEDLDIERYKDKISDPCLESFKDAFLSLRDRRFLIVGDYDCDGICSTAIMKRLCEYLGIRHNFYIPSRSKDGYGLNEDIVRMAFENGFDVILTVDNGIVAKGPLSLAKELGLDVLILDHHEYEEEPECLSFIHPALLPRPYQKLSAGGLSYLFSSLFHDDDLSLVYGGIAVLADMVGVLGYDRYLIKRSIEMLNEGGIYQIDLLNGSDKYNYNSLSFNVIPKINAISRMEYNPNILVKYLLAEKRECLESIASIEAVNKERKELTERMVQTAYRKIDRSRNLAIVISEDIKEGLCGLIANRLIHSLNKPVLVFNRNEGILKGSGRSPETFNIHAYLSGIRDIFTSFGGHEQACGLSLDEKDLDKLYEYIDNTSLNSSPVRKNVFEVDIEDLDMELCDRLEDLRPFGSDLSEPLLLIRDVEYSKKLIMAGKYPKYLLGEGLSAISFKDGKTNDDFNALIGYLRKDRYKRNERSFIIEDSLSI